VVSLYIHVPYCRDKCYYCDFFSFKVERETDISRYVDYLLKELSFYENTEFDTIYVGGGTPSIVSKEDSERLFKGIGRMFDLKCCSEYTVEVNPESVSSEKLEIWLENGVNRFSIGVQSFNDRVLAAVNRVARQRDINRAVGMLKERGVKNFSIDLIMGIQDRDTYVSDLKRAVAMEPSHLSVYFLGVSEGTILSDMIRMNKFDVMRDEEYEELYIFSGSYLAEYGYTRYEISNYAKNGCNSLHNLNYWHGGDFIGAGLSAVSTVGPVRKKNFCEFEKYLRSVGRGDKPVAEIEYISVEKRRRENIMLALRTAEGLEASELLDKADGGRLKELTIFIDSLEVNGYADASSGRLILSPKGLLHSNAIITELWRMLEI
jgi:oxygen-independent coproporphyrinogen-3 oxidase